MNILIDPFRLKKKSSNSLFYNMYFVHFMPDFGSV